MFETGQETENESGNMLAAAPVRGKRGHVAFGGWQRRGMAESDRLEIFGTKPTARQFIGALPRTV